MVSHIIFHKFLQIIDLIKSLKSLFLNVCNWVHAGGSDLRQWQKMLKSAALIKSKSLIIIMHKDKITPENAGRKKNVLEESIIRIQSRLF